MSWKSFFSRKYDQFNSQVQQNKSTTAVIGGLMAIGSIIAGHYVFDKLSRHRKNLPPGPVGMQLISLELQLMHSYPCIL